nr:UDP-galactopyranose mutase [Bacteroidota bacterium]
MLDYKFVVVGSGFWGSTIAERIASVLDEDVLVIEKRGHIGGNCYSEVCHQTGIEYHKYGTHIFHTSNRDVWDYINSFSPFNAYRHQVLATWNGAVYQMPINLETINAFYKVNLRPYEVDAFLKKEVQKSDLPNVDSLENYSISKVGRPLYEAFIKGYTWKQWGISPQKIPATVVKRLPFRTNYNESYYESRWQGIPETGYGAIFKKMLSHGRIRVLVNTDFFDIRNDLPENARIFYSGPVDRLLDFRYGKLEWRSLKFEQEIKNVSDFQGTSVMNYTEAEIPFNRIHEWKHLHPERSVFSGDHTLIAREYSLNGTGQEPFYPINDKKNQALVEKYQHEATLFPNITIGGRFGEYKYYDMHQTIANALTVFNTMKHGE